MRHKAKKGLPWARSERSLPEHVSLGRLVGHAEAHEAVAPEAVAGSWAQAELRQGSYRNRCSAVCRQCEAAVVCVLEHVM